ncbi:choice-of-anchor I family protein [Paenibacillus ginsengarvi]|uniref:Multifunctional 2',3'-cyclic-nucleotide 2'-phosphodiesterase/5'-nucleotidase/3'-nucleotidase n=1 Tax=Paenibacillus ginsengarvi TaxID=400777 RepID=A0A3B0CIE0_9BACL|nr:choice-of-anchor I family protein [Paenibacillus ginsengarvi]RKN85133.1 multifunctional 2',3'-cyclic-nucleotide 2'-phosphodiesterase/5'-nucleotidase/3'-nucleotidase [Paenibacillus ginsengarvi]
MKRKGKRLLALLLGAELLSGSLVSAVPAFAAEAVPLAGTPYQANGMYDVNVPHVFINQVYGGGLSVAADTYSSNGFIELYNPTGGAVSLNGWALWYADATSTSTGASGPWEKLNLSGSIPAHSSYLIKGNDTGAAPANRTVDISAKGDLTFSRFINNKGLKVVLMSNQTTLSDSDKNPFLNKPSGYVDMLGTGSNDNNSKIDGYEFAHPSGSPEGTSKKKAIRRKVLLDTDNNKADFEQVDYSAADAPTVTDKGPRSSADGAWGVAPLTLDQPALSSAYVSSYYTAKLNAGGGTPPYAFEATGLPAGLAINRNTGVITGIPAAATSGPSAVTVAVYDNAVPRASVSRTLILDVKQDPLSIRKIGHYAVGMSNADGGVAEIVKYNKDNGKFYLVNGSTNPPTLDIVSLQTNGQAMTKEKSVDVRALSETGGFVYGDLTSVDVNTVTKRVAVSVQEKDANKNGKILVLDYDGQLLKTYEAGKQPDMIKSTADGRYILTADEGEPRTAGIDPEGSVTIADTITDTVTRVRFDDPSVIDDLVHIRGASDAGGIIRGSGTKEDAVFDLEPEYMALSDDNRTAYVSLQENNAVAIVDIAAKKVTAVKGLGYKDLNDPRNTLDLLKDNRVHLENVPFFGMYMPDGIASYSRDGVNYLFTANEGDVTEWNGRNTGSKIGSVKGSLNPSSAAAQFLAGKTEYDSVEVASDMGTDGIYLFGGRSLSVWNADTMTQMFDSGSDFESITAERLKDYFNASHANNTLDNRSAKKGPEPEDIKIGKVGSKMFAFVGLERIGGVMAYDVTDPARPAFAAYVNTRDFSAGLDTDTGPEGIEFIPAPSSPTGLPLLLVAHEVSGTVAVLQLDVTKVELDQKALTLKAGGAAGRLAATVSPVGSGAATVTWSSSDKSVAAVDANGNVTPVAAGQAVISAISADGFGVAETAVTVQPADASTDTWTLTVMHTNDTHAHLADVAKRATLVKQVRAEDGDSILVDAGDVFSGDLYFTKWMGKSDLAFMNYMGYDAMTFGNHEFDQGTKALSEFVRDAKFPFVSSNIDFTKDANMSQLLRSPSTIPAYGSPGRAENVAGIYPYVILDVQGHKVGVFGMTTEDTKETSSPGKDVVFQDAAESAKATVAAMQASGIHSIIALSHLGYGRDKLLAEQVEGIDLIVGGHTHTKLDAPEVVVDAANQTPTVIVQANEWGKFLGRVDITFDSQGVVLTGKDSAGKERLTGSLMAVDASVREDETGKSMLEPYNAQLEELKKEVIGKTSVVLDGERANVRSKETNLGNFIADAMLAKGKVLKQAQIAIQNGGGIRASIDEGDITMGELRTVMPFGNTLYILDVTGKQLLEGLENGVSGAAGTDLPGKFPQVAGMTFKWDPKQPAGHFVYDVFVQNGTAYEPLDLTKTYRIATNSFMAGGGDGYVSFAEAVAAGAYHEDLGYADYTNFIEYIKELGGTIAPMAEGRIVRADKPVPGDGGDDGGSGSDNGSGNGTGNGGNSGSSSSNGNSGNNGNAGNGGETGNGGASAEAGTVVLNPSALNVTTETNASGQTVSKVTVDSKELALAISGAQTAAPAGTQAVIVIDASKVAGATAIDLPADALAAASSGGAVLAIETQAASYRLPLEALNLGSLASGKKLENAQVRIAITPVEGAVMQALSAAADKLGANVAGRQAVSFEVLVTVDGKTTEWNDFGTTYVTRLLYVPSSLDANATAVLFDPATSEFAFVPSTFTTVNGKTAIEAKRPGNSTYSVLSLNKSFSDLNGHWAKKDVEAMASRLIVKGVSDTAFAPDRSITRAEFTALLVSGLGLSPEASAQSFDDVGTTAWFAGYVGKAAKTGLVNGKAPGRFEPDSTITRAEMAVMISRAMTLVDKANEPGGNGKDALNIFQDRAAIPAWASADVASLAKRGIMNGTDAGFAPDGDATRAEAAVTLLRTLRTLRFVTP